MNNDNEYFVENCIHLIDLYGSAQVSFRCYESIHTAVNGVISMPKYGEKEIGCHAVNIVEYNRVTGYFTFANSWGKEWGDGGHGYLPFEYFKDGRIVEMYAAIF